MPSADHQTDNDKDTLRQLDVVLASIERRLARIAQDFSQTQMLAARVRTPAVAHVLDTALDHKQHTLYAVEDAHGRIVAALYDSAQPSQRGDTGAAPTAPPLRPSTTRG